MEYCPRMQLNLMACNIPDDSRVPKGTFLSLEMCLSEVCTLVQLILVMLAANSVSVVHLVD